MSNHSHAWLLPRAQTEFPARGLLPEQTLHSRRETTFLVLTTLFLVSSAALVLVGASRAIDISALLARVAPGLELPTALVLPLGALPFAVGLVATALVCRLFGRNRAGALVGIGAVAMVALAGLMRLCDVIDGGDAFGVALAFVVAFVAGHAINVAVVTRVPGRGAFWRIVIAAIVANVVAWSAFAGVLHAGAGTLTAPIADETLLALAAGAAAVSFALVLVLAIPAALAARALALALRVGRDGSADRDPEAAAEPAWTRKRQPALISDDGTEVARPRARRPSLQPFSSAEMRFFTEGDALGDG